ncbi:phytoene desaturase family protein [Subtercola frigoramans]|uniref:Phytoene dehydrogenase-like protein n=1 Tax=Subtercola frigoramans TaxID=120298 RepID=A0ABS2L9C5_9MICO|nr:NAD(P)/FAD-dependent oxidoreductase [Subtercola frigoramans]MBM7473708.1 phytoene dehydrogenase-like protein [Subtercola frigoramans]
MTEFATTAPTPLHDPSEHSPDIVIVGGGHNGLAAAAYLARAGLSVTVLERLAHTGGAAVSTSPFEGVDARISRYSYLVSLLPQKIVDDLGLRLSFAERRYSSYTPVPGGDGGLLIDTHDAAATRASFESIGAGDDAELFTLFYEHCAQLTGALWPTLTEPLLRRRDARALVGHDETWEAMIERPIGDVIERHLQNDLVRGVILTDALIGTFARATDPGLAQNVCFLYHLIGNGTGLWNVPIGGMGAVTDELLRAASEAGATIVTGAEVLAIDGGSASVPATVTYAAASGERVTVGAETVLANVAPAELERLRAPSTPPAAPPAGSTGLSAELGRHERNTGPVSLSSAESPEDSDTGTDSVPAAPEGAQAKVNLLLTRLPRVRDSSLTPEAAFGGTFHINETYSQLDRAYFQAASGSLPEPLPCEIYCHSLADPSILSPALQAAGAQTLTVFALHTPHRLITRESNDAFRAEVQAAVLASLNSVLAEPIEDCLMRDANGQPCIETKTTLDIEDALRMPGGNIFHAPLSWPFVDDDATLNTPAERWGVETADPRILLCGSGSRRGGAVSALGGHSAAMAVLEARASVPHP